MSSSLEELCVRIQEKERKYQELKENRRTAWKGMDELDRALFSKEIEECQAELTQLIKIKFDLLAGFEKADFGCRPFSAAHVREMEEKLSRPLTSEDLKSLRKGGGSQWFAETNTVIEKANEIFGFNYKSEITRHPIQLLHKIHNDKHVVEMAATVRVTLANGCSHEEIGITSNIQADEVEARKVAAKGCVSDALKRALSRFGPALGGCLKDKDYVATLNQHSSNRVLQNISNTERPEIKRVKCGHGKDTVGIPQRNNNLENVMDIKLSGHQEERHKEKLENKDEEDAKMMDLILFGLAN